MRERGRERKTDRQTEREYQLHRLDLFFVVIGAGCKSMFYVAHIDHVNVQLWSVCCLVLSDYLLLTHYISCTMHMLPVHITTNVRL